MNASQLIRDRFPTLSPGLQRAGKYALDRPHDIVIASMRTVAAQAAVPPATLVRFAQALGYAGWPAFKQAMVQELGLVPAPYSESAQRLVAQGQSAQVDPQQLDTQLLNELFAAQQHNLQFTKKHSGEVMRRAGQLLIAAPQVHAAGFRASYPLAYQLVYLYRLFRPSVQLIDGQAGGLEMQLRALNAGDAVVVASFAPYSVEAQTVAQTARARGCKVVAITDSAASPLSLLADETLLFSVASPSFFPSITAGMAAVEALLERVVTLSGSAVVAHIDAAESQLFTSGAYVQRPAQRKT